MDLDADGYLPAFLDMTVGKVHESQWAKALRLPPGSTVVFTKGYDDYTWYQPLPDQKNTFVTRLKCNAIRLDFDKRRGRKAKSIVGDQRVRLKRMKSDLRMVVYVEPKTKEFYHFLTNSFEVKASVIAELYKECWKIELFFKWIKQNLKVKTFLGTTPNAVLTQLWIALCVYLLLSFLKFKAKHLLKSPDTYQPTGSPQLLLRG